MAKSDQQWMFMACALAKSQSIDVPVGCIIVKDDRLIASSTNRKEEWLDPTAHAELVAIREAAKKLGSWRLSDCTLYTTLEPCPMCAEAIIQARIKRLIFGAYDTVSGATGSVFNLFVPKRIYPIPEVTGGIAEEQCETLLKEFFAQQRKSNS